MSWIFGKLNLTILVISICCLYLLAFYCDLGMRDVLVLKFARRDTRQLWSTRAVNASGDKTILYWNTFFGDDAYLGDGYVFDNCSVKSCYATADKSYLNVEEFDAVLFHGIELRAGDELPRVRRSQQFYVYVNLESPENRPIHESFMENYFNLTMTYRLDSDVPWPYGVIRDVQSGRVIAPSSNVTWKGGTTRTTTEKDKNKISTNVRTIIEGKRKDVAWFVSNCKAKSGRLEYVKELSKHIHVDIYGKCDEMRKKSCPRNKDCFREVVEPNYFFYLAFENSLCQDYVTEKLYTTLRYYVIPVVYGGANYSRFAPPGSYINALDFDSPKELAAYLKRLSRDPRQYERYFDWKRYYRSESSTRESACNLCKFLHEGKNFSVYWPLSHWYSDNKCPVQNLLRESAETYATKATLQRAIE